MKRRRFRSVVLRTKKLKGVGFVGCWSQHKDIVTPEDGAALLKYALENCGKPPYDITVEVR